MRGKALAVVLGLVAVAVSGAQLSGSFSTSFTLSSSFSAQNQLTLRLSLPGFEVHSVSSWQNLTLTQQAFTVSGAFGNLGLQVGWVLVPVSAPRWGSWFAQDFHVAGSFFSLQLNLGQIQFTLTIQAGP